MKQEPASRSARYADEFEAVMDGFTRLVESLTPEQWRLTGRNHPQRMNDEDEGRPVGVIAHHVAETGPWILDRIRALAEGGPLPPVDFRASNARHAEERKGVTREDVVRLLGETRGPIAAGVRAIPEEQLDVPHETPAGPATVARRLEMVLIGHVKAHQGSIEAAISEPGS